MSKCRSMLCFIQQWEMRLCAHDICLCQYSTTLAHCMIMLFSSYSFLWLCSYRFYVVVKVVTIILSWLITKVISFLPFLALLSVGEWMYYMKVTPWCILLGLTKLCDKLDEDGLGISDASFCGSLYHIIGHRIESFEINIEHQLHIF